MNISEQLRFLRATHDYTLAQVAQGTGLSVSYLSDLERGRTKPSIETLETIAAFYGLTLSISFTGDIPDTVIVRRSALEDLQDTIARLLGGNHG